MTIDAVCGLERGTPFLRLLMSTIMVHSLETGWLSLGVVPVYGWNP